MAPANEQPGARRHFQQPKSPTFSEVVAGTISSKDFNSILSRYQDIEDGYQRASADLRYLKNIYHEIEQGKSYADMAGLAKVITNMESGMQQLNGGMQGVRGDLSLLTDNVGHLTRRVENT